MSRLLPMVSGGLVLADGAWGTELQKRGLALGEPADLWNLTRPGEVEAVARSYVEAGSRVILTNTFRSNPVALAAYGGAEKAAEINRRGVELSRAAAAGAGAYVFASMGPIGKVLSAGEIEPEAVTAAFRLQAEALAEGGADALLIEALGDPEEARLAIRAAWPTGLPIVVSFAFFSGKKKDRTMMGATPEQAARVAVEEGAAAVGANCGDGPDAFVAIARRLKAAAGDLPVWIKPNAGLPVMDGGRATYAMTPEEFARFLPDLVAAGAAFLGGCCGTGPEFIRALGRAAASCVSSRSAAR